MRPIQKKAQESRAKGIAFCRRVMLLCVIVLAIVIGFNVTKGVLDARAAFAESYTETAGPLASQPAASAAQPGGAQDQDILILVNWDHPVPYNQPDNLVEQSKVFKDEVTLENAGGCINAEAGQAANTMFRSAKAEGIGKYMLSSAYRSIIYQEQLWNAQKTKDPRYGDDPYNRPVKVMPGKCSEHTTGLALDILAVSYQQSNDGYANTPEGKWLKQNAYRFGFILRYPKEKEHITGVVFEPWHYRYVGKQAAEEIVKKGVCLEEYLGKEKNKKN